MKKLAALFLIGSLWSCQQQAPAPIPTPQKQTENRDELAAQINDIQEKYRPGLEEIMCAIQLHHGKLWYAGINSNWKLSKYELDKIKGMFQAAKDIETNRAEVNSIPMINADLDSLSNAIQKNNLSAFKSSFGSLTNSCNSCHRAVNFEFNVITIPTAPPVTNQEFKVISTK